ncbi:uncharacterized protein MELLADRAFT_92403 [Melampsora larici-populina 98AG31]|uniref:CxC1-like cysteine cluster associated with KDZ transposases domain-containing protein n=1 Tax=Melampsora larici-populina (strain 98AG31 / pathotype 3-4-7) TaxID=747676 RepID=F4R9I3_MELLP|nr:uncharacterized protein MELLADRAFT_92403 [Melampsora larici-populina 98AG31]EGG11146.1 hypothetical protein MELLADRAFT_92403 [Melampsora larici-populina 98AG31]
MVDPGKPIPCPLGQPVSKRLKKAKSSAEKELEEFERNEDDWADRRCTKLRNRILIQSQSQSQLNPNANDWHGSKLSGNEPSDPNSPFRFEFDYEVRADPEEYDRGPSPIEDPSDSYDEDDEVVQHVTSVSYQERRVREERQWANNLTPMFIAFMEASKMTMQWGTAAWDVDWKPDCRCLTAKKRTRPVDVVDIFSMYHLVLMPNCVY